MTEDDATRLTPADTARLTAAGHDLSRCPSCGELVVDCYSERRADPDGDGRFAIHVVAFRIGDGHPLGREECPSGQLGWGTTTGKGTT